MYDGQMERNNEDREIDIQASICLSVYPSIYLSIAMIAAVCGGTYAQLCTEINANISMLTC